MAKNEAKRVARAGAFDRFAERASDRASDAGFFLACVGLVLIWVPSYFAFGSLDTWQLVINTATTIVTFLLVALLQNSQRRNEVAMHEKLDALADGSPISWRESRPRTLDSEPTCASSARRSASSVWTDGLPASTASTPASRVWSRRRWQ